jgi:hypothetical protein
MNVLQFPESSEDFSQDHSRYQFRELSETEAMKQAIKQSLNDSKIASFYEMTNDSSQNQKYSSKQPTTRDYVEAMGDDIDVENSTISTHSSYHHQLSSRR